MPEERPSPLWTSSTLSRDKEEPSTVSEVDLHNHCLNTSILFLSSFLLKVS
jgi:hypothetical protein